MQRIITYSFSTLLPSATHQDGIEETSSGDYLKLQWGGRPPVFLVVLVYIFV